MNEEITSLAQSNETMVGVPDEQEIKDVFNNYWKERITTDGKMDMEKIVRELHDYFYVLNYVRIVYNKLTGGRVNNPMTIPHSVVAVVDMLHDELTELEVNKAKDEFIEFIFGQGYFDHLDNKKQIKKDLQNVVWKTTKEQTNQKKSKK